MALREPHSSPIHFAKCQGSPIAVFVTLCKSYLINDRTCSWQMRKATLHSEVIIINTAYPQEALQNSALFNYPLLRLQQVVTPLLQLIDRTLSFLPSASPMGDSTRSDRYGSTLCVSPRRRHRWMSLSCFTNCVNYSVPAIGGLKMSTLWISVPRVIVIKLLTSAASRSSSQQQSLVHCMKRYAAVHFDFHNDR